MREGLLFHPTPSPKRGKGGSGEEARLHAERRSVGEDDGDVAVKRPDLVPGGGNRQQTRPLVAMPGQRLTPPQ